MAQDLLEKAHLEYLRGHGEAARALLMRLLSFDPANGAARQLLFQVEHGYRPQGVAATPAIRWLVAVPAGLIALASLIFLGAVINSGLKLGFTAALNVKQFIPAMSLEAPVWVYLSLALGVLCASLAILAKATDTNQA